MVKKILIIGAIGVLVLFAAIVVGGMVYAPKQSEAVVPTFKIEPVEEIVKKARKSRYETLKEAKFSKKQVVEKQIAPVFEIEELLTEEVPTDLAINSVDENALASLDTVAIIEAMLKEKRNRNSFKSAKAKSRVGDKQKERPKKPIKKYSSTTKKASKKPISSPSPQAVKKVENEQVDSFDYMADKAEKSEKEESYKDSAYDFDFYSKQTEKVNQGDFVRAELSHKLKVRSGSSGIELKLLEACTIGGRAYIQGDIMHGFSRLTGQRVQINISSITSNETGNTEFVSLDVYDNDFQVGLAYDATANNEKKRLIRNTSRDLIPNRLPGANTARGIVNTIAGTANGKFAKGYQVRISISNTQNINSSYHNQNNK